MTAFDMIDGNKDRKKLFNFYFYFLFLLLIDLQ